MAADRPGYPYADSALVRFIDQRVTELMATRTQREIAAAAGFDRPNAFSMLKRGEMKPSLARIPALARGLNADPAHMFRLGMIDVWPELAPVVNVVFGRQMASSHEAAILLEPWRAATANSDPAPDPEIEAAVGAMLANLAGILRSS